MMKSLYCAAALSFVMASGLAVPASAMDPMMCDEATMTKMQSQMDALTDPAMKMNKDMAMKEMDMAKTAMKDNKMDDCSKHLGMANMGMMMKCDDATMTMMQTEMDAMTDPAMKTNKDMAMKQMDMAKTAMKDNKTDECMMNMGEAMNSMNKKM